MSGRDVVLAKAAAIDRALGRIGEVRRDRTAFPRPIDVEELTVLNIQRAAQNAIDLASHVVSAEGLGFPSSLADTFSLLERAGLLPAELASRLRKMVGFRNVAVQQYEDVDPSITESIVAEHLDDLRLFAKLMVDRFAAT